MNITVTYEFIPGFNRATIAYNGPQRTIQGETPMILIHEVEKAIAEILIRKDINPYLVGEARASNR